MVAALTESWRRGKSPQIHQKSIGGVYVVAILRRPAMSERVPNGDVRELHLLARKTIERQKQLLTEADHLLRNSRDLISRAVELIRRKSAIEAQHSSGRGAKRPFRVLFISSAMRRG
jgi:hypothetical protein